MSDDVTHVRNGKWHRANKNEQFKLICCDCCLTHWVEIGVNDRGELRYRMRRDDKETRKYRKRFGSTNAVVPK
jgi:hypothetical protein